MQQFGFRLFFTRWHSCCTPQTVQVSGISSCQSKTFSHQVSNKTLILICKRSHILALQNQWWCDESMGSCDWLLGCSPYKPCLFLLYCHSLHHIASHKHSLSPNKSPFILRLGLSCLTVMYTDIVMPFLCHKEDIMYRARHVYK